MATTKKRRKQLAHATAQRRAAREARRRRRQRQIRLVALGLVIVVAATALVVWILTHDSGSDATRAARGDYDASVDRTRPPNIEVIR